MTTNSVEIVKHHFNISDADVTLEHRKSVVAQKVFDIRTQLGLTQLEFAEEAGISKIDVERLEKSNYPDDPEVAESFWKLIREALGLKGNDDNDSTI